MTRIDKYLERYLDGSITEREMNEFRDLLESEPRLHAELSETLELRSVLHDDFLAIEVPESLSSRVLRNVGADFAALAYATPPLNVEEEEEERRGGLFPALVSGRMAGSMAVAMIALLMIGLTPTLNRPADRSPADPSLYAALGTLNLEEAPSVLSTLPAATEGSSSLSVRSTRSVERSTTESEEPVSSRNTLATLQSRSENLVEPDLLEPDLLGAEELAETELGAVHPLTLGGSHLSPNRLLLIEENGSMLESIVERSNLHGNVRGSLGDLLTEVTSEPRGLAIFSFGGGRDDEELPQLAMIDLKEKKETYQRIMLGGTLASGVTSSSSGITLEGSAYLALGIDERSRIGLEGGSATFRYSRNVQVEILTPSVQASAARVVVGGGEEEPTTAMSLPERPSGGAGSGDESGKGGGEEIDALGNRALPQDVVIGENSGPRVSRTDGFDVTYGLESQNGEASKSYGLVFYDHTVTSLSDKLNLNGRVGVGGTDGGIVMSARAYAAISTHRNVAWTIGVGGSMLHEFKQDTDFNANYGLNAGVEFGF